MIYSCAITEVLNVAMWRCGSRNAQHAHYRRKVIFEGRKLRIRGHEITVRSKTAIKRVQSHARMSSAERKQARC